MVVSHRQMNGALPIWPAYTKRGKHRDSVGQTLARTSKGHSLSLGCVRHVGLAVSLGLAYSLHFQVHIICKPP